MINNTGDVFECIHTVDDNINCQDGNYAAHTGGGNTGSIGVAMCGMWTPTNVPVSQTRYPLTKIQCEACFKLCAELAKKYNIEITTDTVLTHYEFGLKHPNTTSRGKIDINHLKCYNLYDPNAIGNFIRSKVKWYRSKMV